MVFIGFSGTSSSSELEGSASFVLIDRRFFKSFGFGGERVLVVVDP